MERLNVRIVDNLEFVVIDEWLRDGGKVQEDCPEQECKVWNEAAGFLHGRYYVKVRRDSADHHRGVCRYPGNKKYNATVQNDSFSRCGHNARCMFTAEPVLPILFPKPVILYSN